MQMEGDRDHGSRGMCRPHPHAAGDTAEVQCIVGDGIFEREKQSDDL